MRPALALVLIFLSVSTPHAATHDKFLHSKKTAELMCPEVVFPVCATNGTQRKTYGNHCKAQRDGTTDIKPGACEAVK